MYLKELQLINYKCYSEAKIKFSEKITCFVGNNGAGKTNILDSVYYLSMCKSYLNPIDSQNIKHDESFFVIQATIDKKDEDFELHFGLKRNQKKVVKKNKKPYEKISEHIGLFPSVIISPYDSDLIKEGSETRRKFIDSIISQINKPYLHSLQQYNKCLQQRNSLLKAFQRTGKFDSEQLSIWTGKMIELGLIISKERQSFIEEFSPYFQESYALVSNGTENVGLNLETQFSQNEDLEALYRMVERKDVVMGRCTVGVHKDDWVFNINQYPIKKYGSQGQQKSFLIALKLAQYTFLKTKNKDLPILLLDDIFDKLDHGRVKNLLKLVASDEFGQVLITDTDIVRLEKLLNECSVKFDIFNVNDSIVKHD